MVCILDKRLVSRVLPPEESVPLRFDVMTLNVFSPTATRKKLFEIARTFSEKTKRRKSKRKVLLKHHSYPFLSARSHFVATHLSKQNLFSHNDHMQMKMIFLSVDVTTRDVTH